MKKVVRTLVYLRPDAVVIDDRVELADGGYGATWAAHVKAAPPTQVPESAYHNEDCR